MNNHNLIKRIYLIVSCLILMIAFTAAIAAQTTAFNYQGKLTDAGSPANGGYLLEFKLYDAVAGGSQIGATLTDIAVTATAGVFNTQLDFGALAFAGSDRFIEIAVKKNAGDPYIVLSPRQQIASSPYSIRTLSAAQADVALDANKLGGVNAVEYVTTTNIGNTFVKNTTTQQTGNFNISGNGIVGGNLGVGTLTPTSKLQVQSNGYGFTQTNGTVTVGSYISQSGGWLGTQTNHPLYFFTNNSLPQMTLNTAGNFGIGTDPTIGKLHVFNNAVGGHAIFGQSLTGRGLWGISTNHRGVQGDSTSGQGVYGTSISSSGVYGETAVSSLTAAGVYGKGIGSGSIGVIGEANIDNATGVFGVSTSPDGFGIYARNNSGGRAIFAEGNVAQALSSNGLVKAMATIEYNFTSVPTIVRCYNSVINSSSGGCGFIVGSNSINGLPITDINFGFRVDDRFISATGQFDQNCCTDIGLLLFPNSQTVRLIGKSRSFYVFIF